MEHIIIPIWKRIINCSFPQPKNAKELSEIKTISDIRDISDKIKIRRDVLSNVIDLLKDRDTEYFASQCILGDMIFRINTAKYQEEEKQ